MFRSVKYILTDGCNPAAQFQSVKVEKNPLGLVNSCLLCACDSLSLIVFILPRIAEFVLKAHKVKSFLLFNSLDLFIDLLGNTLLFCN